MSSQRRPAGIRRPTYTQPRQLQDFAELMKSYDLVDIAGSALVVAPRKELSDPAAPDLHELGSTSASPWTGWLGREYNSTLRDQQGVKKYDEMRRSDGTVAGALSLVKTPVLAARWFMEPASDSTRDKNVAKYVWWNLTRGMSTSWPQFLTECLLMLDYGYYMFEKVFTVTHTAKEAAGKVAWKKFAPRHPLDVQNWLWDAHGGPAGVEMYSHLLDPTSVTIPISKMMVFTHQKEAGDMTGISLLRPAYKPWYFKSQLEKIDAIQKERHGIGIPVIKLPVNFTPTDKTLAQNMGRNLRTNEQAHVVLPPGWDIMFADLQGNPVNALDSIKYHNSEIAKRILAPFMDAEAPNSGKDDDRIMFLKSTRFIADIVTDVINCYAIPELVDYNWTKVGYPRLVARRIGEQADWRTMSMAVRNFVGAGIVRPDDELEANIRDEMDLPAADVKTTRLVATPQAGPGGAVPGGAAAAGQANVPAPPTAGAAGMPRQAPVAKAALPRANAGIDHGV